MKEGIVGTNFGSSKAFRELNELFELQTKRIAIMEQQFMDLSARVNSIENSRQKPGR